METSVNYNDKQLQILRVAENLFAEKGFEGASVRDIAENAGVNVAMISYYFGSKERLMEAIFEERMNFIRLRIEALVKDDSLDPMGKVSKIISEHIDRAIYRMQFYKLMLCEQVINKNPTIINLITEIKKRNLEVISKLITDGQEKGVFRKDIDILLLFNTMYGTVSQMLVGSDIYKAFNGLANLSNEEYYDLIKEKLNTHLQFIFKAVLTYEA
jgi:AcrR family transcriptional regulator